MFDRFDRLSPAEQASLARGVDWSELDRAARACHWTRWLSLQITDLPQLPKWSLALATMHRNGHIRQAALEQLPPDPDLLPIWLLRSTDWVPPVRTLAQSHLEQCLQPSYLPGWTQYCPLVLERLFRQSNSPDLAYLSRLPNSPVLAYLAQSPPWL